VILLLGLVLGLASQNLAARSIGQENSSLFKHVKTFLPLVSVAFGLAIVIKGRSDNNTETSILGSLILLNA
jgi:cadmium resistance protein CadD (predicted permease)